MYPGVGTFVLIRPTQTFYERIIVRYLILKDSTEVYDKFVKNGLRPERELHDAILENIRLSPNPPKDRDGRREDSGRG